MTLEVSHLTEKVRTNLVYYNLWTHAEVVQLQGCQVIRATPPEKDIQEWVLPVDMKDEITMDQIDQVFTNILKYDQVRPEKILFGMYKDDGTIMYYTVHDGIVKPRQS